MLVTGTVWRHGCRHPSLHMDVRFLACPSENQKPHSPSRDQNQTELLPADSTSGHITVSRTILALTADAA